MKIYILSDSFFVVLKPTIALVLNLLKFLWDILRKKTEKWFTDWARSFEKIDKLFGLVILVVWKSINAFNLNLLNLFWISCGKNI